MRATLVPWSSVVGQSISVTDGEGQNLVQLSVRYTGRATEENDEAFKARIIGLAQGVTDAINGADALRREADRLKALQRTTADSAAKWCDLATASEAREAEMRAAMEAIVQADTHLVWTGGSVREPSHEEFGDCAKLARAALHSPASSGEGVKS